MMESEATDVMHDDQPSLKYTFSATPTEASTQQPIQAVIKGTVPSWVKGSLFRNGSGVYKIGDTEWRHLFDGFAVVHRWAIQDGRVTYLSSLLDTDHFKRSFAADRLVGSNFGTASFPDPCKNIFQRFFSRFLPPSSEPNDNTAVNIVEMGDRLFALSEYPIINEVDRDTLKIIETADITKYLSVHSGTAHPHIERDGTVYYYGTLYSDYKKAYNIIRVPRPKQDEGLMTNCQIVGTIPSRWKFNIAYVHSFGMSKNYFIFLELPFVVDTMRTLTKGLRAEALADAMKSYPDEDILIHVMEKKTGKRLPITYQAPHGFAFHFINCYEEEDHLIVDVCLSDKSQVKDLYLETLVANELTALTSGFVRYVLPLNVDGAKIGDNVNRLSGSEAVAVLSKENLVKVEADKPFGDDLFFELPQINYSMVNGLKYRYMYGSTFFAKNHDKKVLKLDLVNNTAKTWLCGENHEPSEPVFVPRPDATDEDDGVILCPIVSKTSDKESFLLILDAATFQEIARASLPTDVKMSYTLHGMFSSKI